MTAVLQSSPLLARSARRCACGGVIGPDGECAACKARRLQRQATAAGPATAPPIVHDVLRSAGRPLEPGLRDEMEARFGHDFSRVRVHTDARAAESARAVDALAYTVGPEIVFDDGRYSADTTEGKCLLTHELAHVVQQDGTDSRQTGRSIPVLSPADPTERAAERAAATTGSAGETGRAAATRSVQRLVRPENVSCHATGLTNPDLTGQEAVDAIATADAEAIELAFTAEVLLDGHLALVRAGQPVDAEFDTILQEELGLTLTNPAHFRLIEQQRNRFTRVRELLESGFLRYMCRGTNVSLVGCSPPGSCTDNRAFSCPANRLIVLCQAFWDLPDFRGSTIMHEPFHVLFSMLRHAPNALRRADALCFESFARRIAGLAAPQSCAGHTDG